MNPSEASRRYQALARRLQPFERCWNQSVIQGWPSCGEALPQSWVDALQDLPLEQLYQLDLQLSFATEFGVDSVFPAAVLPLDLQQLLADFSSLVSLPKSPQAPALAASISQGLTEKKQHELGALIQFLSEQSPLQGWQRGIDIGGGVGHLARNLVMQTGLPMISIDQDRALQDRGRELLRKEKNSERCQILSFVESVIRDEPQPEIDGLFSGPCISLGLHTCGPLAVVHMKKSRESAGILNFGCCYDRIKHSSECHLSQLAIELDIPLSTYALFLATRGRHRSWDDFRMQQRVNYYRFALHLLLQAEGLVPGFVSVGDAPKSMYHESFAVYAESRFAALGWSEKFHQARATDFFSKHSLQSELQRFFIVNILRNCFARPLEFIVLLDRVIWLMEQGREVAMLEFFEHGCSPRNIGIYAVFGGSSR